jgi:hypothetical protein
MTISLAGAGEDLLQPAPATSMVPIDNRNRISDPTAVSLDLIICPSEFSLQYTKRPTF